MMVASPTQTKKWYRKEGWFNEREEKILVNLVIRDDPTTGDMHDRQATTLKLLWKSLYDFNLWPISLFPPSFGRCLRVRQIDILP